MIYCTAETKATSASVQVVGVDFEIDMDRANVFVIELRDSLVFSVLQTLMDFE
jgi:hypothetical protein